MSVILLPTSLFVNGVHILDADEHNEHPIEEIAESLSAALDTPVSTVKITKRQLAIAIAKERGEYDELEVKSNLAMLITMAGATDIQTMIC